MTSSGKYVKMPDERSTHVSNLLLCNALASIPAIFTREITREFLGPRTVSNCRWLRRFSKDRGCGLAAEIEVARLRFIFTYVSIFLLFSSYFLPNIRQIIRSMIFFS